MAVQKNMKGKRIENLDLDEAVIESLPSGCKVVSVKQTGAGHWVGTVKISLELIDGQTIKYFKKETTGQDGANMMSGAFEAENALYSFVPELVPRPISWGKHRSQPDTYFYMSEHVNMSDQLPSPESWAEAVSRLHMRSKGRSPTQNFGFHVTTHLANIPVDNTWNASWQAFWTQQIRGLMDREERAHGQDNELTELKVIFFSRVIPRYLGQLECEGRSVEPCLVHSDLWPGNIKRKEASEEVIMFDACAYWGHHEADLAICRNPRYKLGMPYIEAYLRKAPASEPVEDFDGRNAVYAMKFHTLLSIMYYPVETFRKIMVEELRLLVARVEPPDGKETPRMVVGGN